MKDNDDYEKEVVVLPDDIKIDAKFLKDAYKDTIVKLYLKILNDEADPKIFNIFLNEIKRHDIDVIDVDKDELISFVGGNNVKHISIPLKDLKSAK